MKMWKLHVDERYCLSYVNGRGSNFVSSRDFFSDLDDGCDAFLCQIMDVAISYAVERCCVFFYLEDLLWSHGSSEAS